MKGIKMSAEKTKKIVSEMEKKVKAFKVHYDVNLEGTINLNEIAKKLGFTIKEAKFKKGANHKIISGAISVNNQENEKLIYVNADEPYYRKRFTIAHEIAHYYLEYKDTEKDIENIDFRSNMNSNKESELRANKFAAALLMPKATILALKKDLNNNLNLISSIMQVSTKSIKKRFEELSCLETSSK